MGPVPGHDGPWRDPGAAVRPGRHRRGHRRGPGSPLDGDRVSLGGSRADRGRPGAGVRLVALAADPGLVASGRPSTDPREPRHRPRPVPTGPAAHACGRRATPSSWSWTWLPASPSRTLGSMRYGAPSRSNGGRSSIASRRRTCRRAWSSRRSGSTATSSRCRSSERTSPVPLIGLSRAGVPSVVRWWRDTLDRGWGHPVLRLGEPVGRCDAGLDPGAFRGDRPPTIGRVLALRLHPDRQLRLHDEPIPEPVPARRSFA